MQCLSVAPSSIPGKDKIWGDKLLCLSLLKLLRIPQRVKIHTPFSEGEKATAGIRCMHSLIVPRFRAQETLLHTKCDLLWENGVLTL